MFRPFPNRSRFTALAIPLAAAVLAACGSDTSNGGACTLELPASISDAQLQHVVQALRSSTDPCGTQGPLPPDALRAQAMTARQAELVSIDRGDAWLRVSFAVANRSE
jgi:hypothetical protein